MAENWNPIPERLGEAEPPPVEPSRLPPRPRRQPTPTPDAPAADAVQTLPPGPTHHVPPDAVPTPPPQATYVPPPPPHANTAYVPPPITINLQGGERRGFWGRIVSSIVMGWVIRIVMSLIFFGSPAWMPFVLAALLGLFGWKVVPPEAVKKAAHNVAERAEKVIDAAGDKIGEKMKGIKDKVADRVEKVKERAEGVQEKVEEAKAKAELVATVATVTPPPPPASSFFSRIMPPRQIDRIPPPPLPVKSAEAIAREEELRTRLVTAFGETKTVAEWAKDPICRVKDYELLQRIKDGWEPHKAIDIGPSDIRSLGAYGLYDANTEAAEYGRIIREKREAEKNAELERRRRLPNVARGTLQTVPSGLK